MSNSPVLPYCAQDTVPNFQSPARMLNKKALQILVPPHSARTTSSGPWPPRTSRTTRTVTSGASTWSTPLERLGAVIIELEEERDGLDAEKSENLQGGEHSSYVAGRAGEHEGDVRNTEHVREHWRHILHHPKFHYAIIALVIVDLIAVFLDITISLLNLSCYTDAQLAQFSALGVSNPPISVSCVLQESAALVQGEWLLWAISVFLLCIFTLEIFASLFAFGPEHFVHPLYAIDAVVVFASLIMEVYFKFGDQGHAGQSPAALIVLRLWKIVRAIHAIAHSIELKNLSIIEAVREAMAEVEEQQRATSVQFQRDELKLKYFRDRLPYVRDDELEHYADSQMEMAKGAHEEESMDETSKGSEASSINV